jgi:uncharacterized membrane protein YvlD (DUF360 family)
MNRFVRWALAVALTQTVLLLLLAWLLAGFNLSGVRAAFVSSVVISLALAVTWPFIYSL